MPLGVLGSGVMAVSAVLSTTVSGVTSKAVALVPPNVAVTESVVAPSARPGSASTFAVTSGAPLQTMFALLVRRYAEPTAALVTATLPSPATETDAVAGIGRNPVGRLKSTVNGPAGREQSIVNVAV